eukprot:scaffold80812_cov70-Phaeocystis_antarctica.AAC.2
MVNKAKAGAGAQPPACLRPHAPRQRPTLPLARGCPLTALSAPETEEAEEEAAAALWRLPKVADSIAYPPSGPTVAGGWPRASMAKSWLRLGGLSRCHSKLPRPPGTPSFGCYIGPGLLRTLRRSTSAAQGPQPSACGAATSLRQSRCSACAVCRPGAPCRARLDVAAHPSRGMPHAWRPPQELWLLQGMQAARCALGRAFRFAERFVILS